MTKNFIYQIDIDKILSSYDTVIDEKNILKKENRPYFSCVELNKEYSAFIPIRTYLPHKYGFITKTYKTKERKLKRSGLDYTKSLIFKSKYLNEYIINTTGISFSEYKKIESNIETIILEYKDFLFNTFIPIMKKDPSKYTPKERNIYNFSSLQYMENIIRDLY